MQIGRAFKLYLGDWKDTYPPNKDTAGAFSAQIQLAVGTEKAYIHGVNWIEALQPFMEKIELNSAGAWRCSAASSKYWPNTGAAIGTTARDYGVTYAFNANMVNQPEGVIKAASQLMLVREMDRKMNAVLRPLNLSPDGNTPPQSAFLTASESGIGCISYVSPDPKAPNPKQHGQGSNILFADAHVKNYALEYYPDTPVYDVTDLQWYNFNTGPVGKMKSIAITP